MSERKRERERGRERKAKKEKESNNKLILLFPLVVPFDVERDLKLMTSILGIEHYTLIMLGAITVSDSKTIIFQLNVFLECNYNFSGISNVAYALAFDAIMRDYRGTHSILRENVFGWTSCKTR